MDYPLFPLRFQLCDSAPSQFAWRKLTIYLTTQKHYATAPAAHNTRAAPLHWSLRSALWTGLATRDADLLLEKRGYSHFPRRKRKEESFLPYIICSVSLHSLKFESFCTDLFMLRKKKKKMLVKKVNKKTEKQNKSTKLRTLIQGGLVCALEKSLHIWLHRPGFLQRYRVVSNVEICNKLSSVRFQSLGFDLNGVFAWMKISVLKFGTLSFTQYTELRLRGAGSFPCATPDLYVVLRKPPTNHAATVSPSPPRPSGFRCASRCLAAQPAVPAAPQMPGFLR